MPDCGVHYLWFAFVCFLITPPRPFFTRRRTWQVPPLLALHQEHLKSGDQLGRECDHRTVSVRFDSGAVRSATAARQKGVEMHAVAWAHALRGVEVGGGGGLGVQGGQSARRTMVRKGRSRILSPCPPGSNSKQARDEACFAPPPRCMTRASPLFPCMLPQRNQTEHKSQNGPFFFFFFT